jgi:sulfide:quinone oxidoreductase
MVVGSSDRQLSRAATLRQARNHAWWTLFQHPGVLGRPLGVRRHRRRRHAQRQHEHPNDIDFFGEHSVTRINAGERLIEFEDGTAVGFDLLVFVHPHEPAVTLDRPGWIAVDTSTMQTQHPGIFAIGDTTAVTSKAAIFAKNGAKAAADNVLRYLGKTDRTGGLSGEGYCYIDTGAHTSARGKGDFFTLPHPEIHLTPPSSELHHEKKQEEQDWRALWERKASVTR